MNNFDIYVDSAANLTEGMIKETGIKVIPFTCTVNGEERLCYEEGVPFSETAKKFYEDMLNNADIKTSLVSQAAFEEALEGSLSQGRDALLITITQTLSGTYAQAEKARKALSEKYPDAKVYVADAANASLGQGLVAYYAAKQRESGCSAEECYKWVEDNKYRVNSYVTIDDLKYLRKSGRVSTILAVAGAILNIKPMLKADGACPATLAVYSKERGRRKSIDELVNQFTNNVIEPENQTIAITHCNCEGDAQALAERLKQLGAKDVVIEYYDMCTGSHVGPGTLALFFLGKDRRQPATSEKKLFGRK
ncbi:MAG: DegV family protein [Clostridia bacterium]|nr:DegV family protein [Clostridia bacterium]